MSHSSHCYQNDFFAGFQLTILSSKINKLQSKQATVGQFDRCGILPHFGALGGDSQAVFGRGCGGSFALRANGSSTRTITEPRSPPARRYRSLCLQPLTAHSPDGQGGKGITKGWGQELGGGNLRPGHGFIRAAGGAGLQRFFLSPRPTGERGPRDAVAAGLSRHMAA